MAGASYWLTTERLGLRRFTPADLDWLAALYADPDVTRHLGGVKHRAQAAQMLDERILRYYDERPGLGMWMTIERSSGVPVGFHLLNNIQGEELLQVGFALLKPAWGLGYGSEMAAAVLKYGFETLRLPRIVAIANLDNLASQRVLLKIGLRRKGERAFSHPAYAAAGPMAWFERDAEEWIAERAGSRAHDLEPDRTTRTHGPGTERHMKVKDPDHDHTPEEERRIREAALDETIENSFPASDPPSTNPNPDDHDALKRQRRPAKR